MPLQANSPNHDRIEAFWSSDLPDDEEAEPLRTPEQVRSYFERNGVSVAAWARARGFSVVLTRMVAAGQRKCLRGQSHQIAVALGMKHGADVNS